MDDPNDNESDEPVRFLTYVTSTSKHTNISSKGNKFREFLFVVLGIGMLLPFNMFITANGYFKYKFQSRPEIQKRFENVFAIASQIPCVIGAVLTLIMTGKVSGTLRIVGSLTVITTCLAITAVFVQIDTSKWTEEFYLLTIGLVVVVNFTSGIYQTTICGVAGLSGEGSIQALFVGVGGGAVAATVCSIFSLILTNDENQSAVGYFATGTVVTVTCIIIYLTFLRIPHTPIVECQDEEKLVSTNYELPPSPPIHQTRVQVRSAFRQIYGKVFLLGYVFFVTMSAFPAVISNIESINKSAKSKWNNAYFSPFVCFLLFNLSDTCGRWITGHMKMKSTSRLLPLLCLLRTIFIPLFMLCNYQPRSHIPVLLATDLAPIILVPLFGLSNGFLQSMCVLHATMAVDRELKEITGAILQMSITLALPVGSAFSFAVVALM